MSQNKDSSDIIKNRLFTGMKLDNLKLKINQKNFIGVKEGDIIFQAGDKSDYIYLVVEGLVKLKILGHSGNPVIIRRDKNDFFGEREIMQNTPRKSSAVAENDCIFYKIDDKGLKNLISTNSLIQLNLSQVEEETGESINGDDLSTLLTEKTSNRDTTLKFKDEVLGNSGLQENDAIKNIKELEESSGETEDDNLEQESTISDLFAPEEPANAVEREDIESTGIEESIENDNTYDAENNSKLDDEEITDEERNDEINEVETEDDINWSFGESSIDEELRDSILEESENIPDAPEKFQIEETESEKSVEAEEEQFYNLEGASDQPAETGNMDDELWIHKLESTLNAVNNINSQIDFEEIRLSIIDNLKYIIGVETVRLFLIKKETNELIAVVQDDNGSHQIKLAMGEGLTGYAAEQNEILNIKDAVSDNRFNPSLEIIDDLVVKDILCFPLANKAEEVLGVVQLINSKNGEFTKIDEKVLYLFSPHIITSFERTERFDKLIHDEQWIFLEKFSNFLIQDITTPLLTIKHYADFIKRKNISAEVNQVLDMLSERANWDFRSSATH